MLTAAGSGYSRCRDLAVRRDGEDVTRDCWGQYVFVRDTQRGQVWSGRLPADGRRRRQLRGDLLRGPRRGRRRDGAISTTTEVVVSPRGRAEVRRISLTNLGVRAREIELTILRRGSCWPADGGRRASVFSNLFVQTEFVPDVSALSPRAAARAARRAGVGGARGRRRGETVSGAQYGTDRARFPAAAAASCTPMSVIDGRPSRTRPGRCSIRSSACAAACAWPAAPAPG
jgi:cyclic beta-1,2-glucan synthetase